MRMWLTDTCVGSAHSQQHPCPPTPPHPTPPHPCMAAGSCTLCPPARCRRCTGTAAPGAAAISACTTVVVASLDPLKKVLPPYVGVAPPVAGDVLKCVQGNAYDKPDQFGYCCQIAADPSPPPSPQSPYSPGPPSDSTDSFPPGWI
jgi:hypothetical protein